jgi:DNA (cytosine-5)-methyltransferase 1
MTVLKVGSFFSGIGSFEQALKILNIKHKIIFACDIDKFCKANYIHNYEIDSKNDWYDDINLFRSDKYINNVDIVVGGCPCQSFSIAGKRGGINDKRGQLVFKYIQKIKELNPNVFIFENVKGLLSIDNGDVFKNIISEMKNINYIIDYKVINALDCNIPQSRERIIIIGRKLNIPNIFETQVIVRNEKKLKEYLDTNVDSKYLITNLKWQNWIFDEISLNKQKNGYKW